MKGGRKRNASSSVQACFPTFGYSQSRPLKTCQKSGTTPPEQRKGDCFFCSTLYSVCVVRGGAKEMAPWLSCVSRLLVIHKLIKAIVNLQMPKVGNGGGAFLLRHPVHTRLVILPNDFPPLPFPF